MVVVQTLAFQDGFAGGLRRIRQNNPLVILAVAPHKDGHGQGPALHPQLHLSQSVRQAVSPQQTRLDLDLDNLFRIA